MLDSDFVCYVRNKESSNLAQLILHLHGFVAQNFHVPAHLLSGGM